MSVAPTFLDLTEKAKKGESLTSTEAAEAMTALTSGELDDQQIASFLTVIREKGETVEELAGFAGKMRELAAVGAAELAQFESIDTCGTGGGTIPTFNVSTAVAFVLAAGGLIVAKHGNRAITSQSGSADALEALGINIELSAREVAACLKEVGIGFLFAPVFHKATANVQRVRKTLNHKTFFNVLGPLTNPAFPDYQVIGVYAPELTEKLAGVLAQFPKTKKAWVVHGLSEAGDGCLDEISLLGPTKISEVHNGKIKNFEICPSEFGFSVCQRKDIIGGTSTENAEILKNILSGKEEGPKTDLVILNAAAGFVVSEKTKDFKEGIDLARQLIEKGEPFQKAEALREFSKSIQRRKT